MAEFYVRVKPRSKKSRVGGFRNGVLEVRVKSPPVNGKANQEVVLLLSKELGIPQKCLRIVSGSRARLKRIRADCLNDKEVLHLLGGG